MTIMFHFEVVGGPYDGAPGMSWLDDGEHPCPDRVWIGRCPGDGSCGIRYCGRSSRPRRHVAYWTSSDAVPMRTVPYEKEIEFVQRDDGESGPMFDGSARYVMGGLSMLPGRRVEELVPAGASDG